MKEKLESINDELFNSFNPDNELWIVGGGSTTTTIRVVTGGIGRSDVGYSYDADDLSLDGGY